MKNAQEYTRRVKQLYTKLKKDGGKASIEVVDDSTRALLMGILCNYTSEQRAAAALRKLLETSVDLNDLRVTPVADLVSTMGSDFPNSRQAATEVTQVLNSVFNSLHHLDLSFLKSQAKKNVATFLQGLDGLTVHAAAYFRNRYLNQGDIPLDDNMVSYLHRTDCLPEGATGEEAQKFINDVFKERDAQNFYCLFKRYASVHATRKTSRRSEPVGAGVGRGKGSPEGVCSPDDEEPARVAETKPTRRRKAAKSADGSTAARKVRSATARTAKVVKKKKARPSKPRARKK